MAERGAAGSASVITGERSGRVPIAVRVAVVGHRWLSDDAPTRDAVGVVLDELWQRGAMGSGPHTDVDFAVISALAEGADRAAAAATLERHGRLEVILPMPSVEYEDDFATADSIARYRELLAAADDVTVLAFGSDREAGYAEAGRRMVDRCDALLAIWDGAPARGRGGTAEIVAYADSLGRPVQWLEALPNRGVQGVRPRAEHPSAEPMKPLGPRAWAALDRYNAQAVVVPAPDATLPAEPRFFQPYFARADQLAIRYQRWLLRSSQLIYTLAVVAVASVAGQLVFFPGAKWLAWVEVVALGVITLVLIWGRRTGLLRRWLAARQFAERIRVAAMMRTAGLVDPPRWGAVLEDGDWVERAVEEVWVRSPRSPDPLPVAHLRTLLIEGWLDTQIDYHRKAEIQARRRLRATAPIAIALFALSLVAAVLHSLDWFMVEGMPAYWSYISILAPAAAAAVSGYFGQREYVRRARRSREAADAFGRARSRVASARDPEQLRAVLTSMLPLLAVESRDWSTTTTMHDLDVP